MQSFLHGEFVAPTERINLGSPKGTRHTVEADWRMRSYARGFLTREGGTPPFAIAVGDAQRIELDVIEPVDRRLVLRMASYLEGEPQDVSVRLNGHLLGSARLRLDGERTPVRFDVPANVQLRGTNELGLRFSGTHEVQLADIPVPLPLAAAVQSVHLLRPGEDENSEPVAATGQRAGVALEVAGGSQTRVVNLPAGVSGRVSLELPDAKRLLLRFRVERVDTSLEVSVVTDDGARTVLADIDHRDVVPRELSKDLTPWAGRAVQLDFWCRGGSGSAKISTSSLLVPEGDRTAPEGLEEAGEDGEAPVVELPVEAPEPMLLNGKRPSFLVVVMDAMARDRTSAFGADNGTTPVLDQLARRSFLVPTAQAPASYTLASVGSLFTGLEPLVHGVVHGLVDDMPEQLADDAPRLALMLAGAGWRTGAWITNPNASARHGFGEGFTIWDELSADADLFVPRVGVDGDQLAPRLASFLAEEDAAPTLSWVHVFEPHAPWRAAEGSATLAPYDGQASGEREWLDAYRLGEIDPASVSPADMTHLRQLYAARLRRADAVLGSLLETLDSSGRADHTVIIVTSDHGEALGEHGRLEHGDDAHVEQIDVPLLFYVPGMGGNVLTGHVRLVDVAPTILGMAGLVAHAEMDGIDLFASEPASDRVGITRSYGTLPVLAIRRWPWRLHFDTATRRVLLFDLSSDPDEEHDLAAEHNVTTAWLHAELLRHVAASRARFEARVGDELDPDAAAALSSLGYVELRSRPDEQADPVQQILRARLLRQ